ncbi:MAG: Cobalt-zinc-cadmium resistance protein [uncultured Chloroflexi bacterium]|uniref:Cobalt-zinc-cadmium resistance protein n=1 Tax=uncultured Chloroflexota bacterium TaxID=166587 RepID=A0A6J4IRX7_9CHLR|nr:MAG: Cobalt-zinc-cadmium resistance protein [uncultured Chloroflexota bacterium]
MMSSGAAPTWPTAPFQGTKPAQKRVRPSGTAPPSEFRSAKTHPRWALLSILAAVVTIGLKLLAYWLTGSVAWWW